MALRERQADSAWTGERPDLVDLIARALPGGRPETVRVLADTARLLVAHPEETIYRQGDPVPLTLILRGYGAFRRTTEDGQLLTAGIGRAGDLFGFSSMASVSSSVDLVALTDCQVAQWPGTQVRALAGLDPGLALDAIDSLANSLHITVGRVEGFLHQDARRRVIRILVRHQDLFFSDPPVLSRGHLPSLVGTSREMTGRVLRQLELEGTVQRVGRAGLRLMRPDRLKDGAG